MCLMILCELESRIKVIQSTCVVVCSIARVNNWGQKQSLTTIPPNVTIGVPTEFVTTLLDVTLRDTTLFNIPELKYVTL